MTENDEWVAGVEARLKTNDEFLRTAREIVQKGISIRINEQNKDAFIAEESVSSFNERLAAIRSRIIVRNKATEVLVSSARNRFGFSPVNDVNQEEHFEFNEEVKKVMH